MTDPNLDALQAAYVRRLNRGAPQRAADLSDARNRALDIGPDRDAVTMATVLREGGPARPRLTRALVALAADTYRTLHGTRGLFTPTRRSGTTGISTAASLTREDVRAGRSCRSHGVRNCASCRPL